jgi:hypothetical protein
LFDFNKKRIKVKFYIVVNTKEGMLMAGYFRQIKTDKESALAVQQESSKPRTMTLKMAHTQLGHLDERWTKDVSKALGWSLDQGKLSPCAACAAGKA